jgi:hypothetical protein
MLLQWPQVLKSVLELPVISAILTLEMGQKSQNVGFKPPYTM